MDTSKVSWGHLFPTRLFQPHSCTWKIGDCRVILSLEQFFFLFCYYFCSSVIFSLEKLFSYKLYRLLIYFLLVSLIPSLRYPKFVFCKSWSTNLFLHFLTVRSSPFWNAEVILAWVFWNHFQGGLPLFWSLPQNWVLFLNSEVGAFTYSFLKLHLLHVEPRNR